MTERVHYNSDIGPTRRRLERNTYLVLAVMIIGSFVIGQVEIILGTILGGALGLLNHRWLSASLGVIVSQTDLTGRVPRWTAWKFVLRLLLVGIVTGLALWSDQFDMLAIAVGFCAFVGAVMIEAGYQICLMLSRQEDSEP